MYIEDTGAGDGDIKITVEGAEYTAEANYDLDGDGVDDTVAVMTDEGYVTYVDDNGDGTADIMQHIDPNGDVVSQARFDPGSGEWVGEQPGDQPGAGGAGQDHGSQDSMVIDTPRGDQQVGPATEDTNNDGRPDTAVVSTDHGTTLVTDVDGDGSADQMVQVNDNGSVTVSHHTGEGQWTVVEHGRIDQNGHYSPNRAASGTEDATWMLGEPEQREQPDSAGSSALEDGPAAGVAGAGQQPPAPDSDQLWA